MTAANGFLDDVTDLDEPVPHQLATIPAGLQVLFGLMDLAMHHDDVLSVTGHRYRPQADTIAAVLPWHSDSSACRPIRTILGPSWCSAPVVRHSSDRA